MAISKQAIIEHLNKTSKHSYVSAIYENEKYVMFEVQKLNFKYAVYAKVGNSFESVGSFSTKRSKIVKEILKL